MSILKEKGQSEIGDRHLDFIIHYNACIDLK